MQNATTEQIVNNNAFSHLILGFPINRKLGASIGMVPFSNIGYEINARDNDYNADMNYYGDGGISKVYFGGAYELSNDFSIGINASYLFGGLNRRKQLVYDDASFLNSRSNSKINLKGYYYELGLLYKTIINENDAFTIGFTTNNNSSIRAKKSEIVESFEFSGFSEVPKDTFVNITEWGDITLPRYTSFGISYNKDNKWLFVADYSLQDWADYTMFDESDNLANSMRMSGGIQYTPEYNSVTKYYKRMDYRFGASYSNTPLQFDNRQLTEKSISFGFGIPVKKSRTKYDFSCTLAQRGTVEDKLIKEQFVRLGLSVSYDGIWFVKRKYD
jgi:long-subunit fatty acid transport protein